MASTLGRDVALVTRHWLLILVAGTLGLAAGFGWWAQQPPTYTSAGSVLLSPLSGDASLAQPGAVPKPVSIDTDAQLATSDTVLDAVSATTAMSPAEVRRALSISAPPLTRVLRLDFQATDPDVAQRGAQAAMEALLEAREDALTSVPAAYVASLRAQIAEAREQRARIEGEARIEQQLTRQIERLEATIQRLERDAAGPGRIIVEATRPGRADGGEPEVPLAGGLLAGMLAGVAAAAVLEQRRRAAARAAERAAARSRAGI